LEYSPIGPAAQVEGCKDKGIPGGIWPLEILQIMVERFTVFHKMGRYFLTIIAVWAGDETMMKNSFGGSKKSLSFWATLLVVGFGGLPLRAADNGGAFDFSRTSMIYGVCGLLLLLLAAAGTRRWTQQWRARVLRERDGEMFQLMNQWTRSLQQEVAERKSAPEKNPPDTAAPQARGGGETILVVEDETVLRELVREILEVHGYRVLDAASGREALQAWEKHGKSVDLLLTDMVMPDGMSGHDVAAKLQEDNPRLPVIFSSGYSQESLERGEPAGQGQTFLSKPYLPADLAQAVRAALDKAACGEAALASPDP
jgi:CheY-like chemotaxis protein